MGAQADGNALKAAAEAHHKAIGSIDATGVTSAADYAAVNAALGRVIASVPKSTGNGCPQCNGWRNRYLDSIEHVLK
eukprot:4410844-Amphidinium_carterae.1